MKKVNPFIKLCISCGKDPCAPGEDHCQDCLDYFRKAWEVKLGFRGRVYEEGEKRKSLRDRKGNIMGACGCGDYNPSFKFKGPGNNWYVLQHYPGCSYCDTPAGVIIYDMSP